MNNTTTNNALIDANYLLKRFQTFEHAYAICNTHSNIKADEQFSREISHIKTMIKQMANVQQPKQAKTTFN